MRRTHRAREHQARSILLGLQLVRASSAESEQPERAVRTILSQLSLGYVPAYRTSDARHSATGRPVGRKPDSLLRVMRAPSSYGSFLTNPPRPRASAPVHSSSSF